VNALNRVVALVLVFGALLSGTLQAQQPQRVVLETALGRDERITVQLHDGRRLSGVVGARLTAGFYLNERTDSEVFVRYGTVKALLDPDTGIVVGIPAAAPRDRRWVKPVLITAGIVGGLAILTRGVIPLCFFNRHYCFD